MLTCFLVVYMRGTGTVIIKSENLKAFLIEIISEEIYISIYIIRRMLFESLKCMRNKEKGLEG